MHYYCCISIDEDTLGEMHYRQDKQKSDTRADPLPPSVGEVWETERPFQIELQMLLFIAVNVTSTRSPGL